MLRLERHIRDGDLGRGRNRGRSLLHLRGLYPAVRHRWPPGVLHDVHHLLHQGSAGRRFRWASILAHPVLAFPGDAWWLSPP